MKDKEFTLVQFFIVAVLAIIVVLAIYNVLNTDNFNNELREEDKLAIENASRAFGIKNYSIDSESLKKYITVKELIKSNAIKKNDFSYLNESQLNKIGVCIIFEDNQFIYNYVDDVNDCDKK